MAISFNSIPAALRVPGFYIEFESAGGGGSVTQRALLIGQAVGTVVQTPSYAASWDDVAQRCGAGSMLARMMRAYRRNDSLGEVYLLPLNDAASSVAATGTVAITGPATGAGTVSLYIEGERVQAGVASGDTATTVAAALAAAVNANVELPVTATASSGTVTLTARNKGTVGNGVDLRLNYLGTAGGEALPAGLAVAITAMSGGATDPDLAALGLDALLGDFPYDFVVSAYASTAALDAIKAVMNAVTGRWSYSRKVYGHAWAAKRDSVANLLTLGAARNDEHLSLIGYEAACPTSEYMMAAALTAAAAVAIRADPARPLQTLAVTGARATPLASRFGLSNRQSLLSAGIGTIRYAEDGTVQIERAATTYTKNAQAQIDETFRDVETMYTLMALARAIETRLLSRYPRHKLAADGTRFGPGQAIVTPKIAYAELIALYGELEDQGLVESADTMAANTIVERSSTDPSRLNILWSPDLINGLRVMAAKVRVTA